MRMKWLCVALVGLMSAAAFGQVSLLDQNKVWYAKEQARIDTFIQQALAKAAVDYEQALGNLKETLKKSGDLDGVLAVNKELAVVTAGKAIPSELPANDAVARVVKKAQAGLVQIEAAKQKYRADLAQRYIAGLTNLKKQLVAKEQLDEAVEVDAEIKAVQSVSSAAPQSNTVSAESNLVLHFDLTKKPEKETEIEGGKNVEGIITGAKFEKGGFQFKNQSGNKPDPKPDSSHDYIYVKPGVGFFPINDFSISVIFKANNDGSLIGSGQNEFWQKEWVLRPQSFNWASIAGHSSGAVGRRNDIIAFKTHPDKCHHIVITRAGETVRAYINGVFVSVSTSFPRDPLPIYSYGLMIGSTKVDAEKWTRWYGYDGLIADVRIYNKALTDAEVKNLNKTLVNANHLENKIRVESGS